MKRYKIQDIRFRMQDTRYWYIILYLFLLSVKIRILSIYNEKKGILDS